MNMNEMLSFLLQSNYKLMGVWCLCSTCWSITTILRIQYKIDHVVRRGRYDVLILVSTESSF